MSKASKGMRHPDPELASVAHEWATAMVHTQWRYIVIAFALPSVLFGVALALVPTGLPRQVDIIVPIDVFGVRIVLEYMQRSLAKKIIRL